MERYGLPIAFAAALHGAVLFGFNCRPTKASAAKVDTITIVCPLPLPPLDESELLISADDIAKTGAPEPETLRPPTAPEPTALPSDCTFPIEVPRRVVNVAIDPNMRNLLPPTGPGREGPGPFGPGNIISSTLLDRVPTARLQAQPLYPLEATRVGLSGQVMVDFTVDERGDVVEARVVSSSDRVFEEAATRAVLKWKFEPGRRNGGVVPFRMTIPIQFSRPLKFNILLTDK